MQRGIGIAVALVCALSACRSDDGGGADVADAAVGNIDATPTGADAAAASAPAMRVATWNLHNFSQYGDNEFRLDEIAGTFTDLDADIIAVQELEPHDSGSADAFETLMAMLPGYEGIHNAYRSFDTSVGMVYRTETVTVLSSQALFTDDGYAFPRPPLEARVRVTRDGASVELDVIVLHLKAFGDSVDRRRDALQKLDAYLDQKSSPAAVVLGDYNDDPYDAPADNSFTGTFLDAQPDYYFTTAALPPESVTSTGYYHWVDGQQITGEFLDHVVVTGALQGQYTSTTPLIHGVPSAQFDDWARDYSDHFPVTVDFAP